MKSGWDDAPDYIRNNKKQSPWRTVVILGIGSAITWGLIALFDKPIVIDVNQLKQAIRVGGQRGADSSKISAKPVMQH